MTAKKFAALQWTDEMSVGDQVIDKDHKKLFSLLNEMEYIARRIIQKMV